MAGATGLMGERAGEMDLAGAAHTPSWATAKLSGVMRLACGYGAERLEAAAARAAGSSSRGIDEMTSA